MKKLISVSILLSSLCFARDIESCNGLPSEISQTTEKVLQFSTSLRELEKHTTMSNANKLYEVNRELEELTDHIMYYHQEELDTVQLNSMRKFKVNSIEADKVITTLRKELENEK